MISRLSQAYTFFFFCFRKIVVPEFFFFMRLKFLSAFMDLMIGPHHTFHYNVVARTFIWSVQVDTLVLVLGF